RLVVIGKRAIRVASVVADFASIRVGLGEAVVEFDGAIEISHRFVRLSPRLEDDAAIVMSHAVTRTESNGLAEVGHCPVGIDYGVIRDTAITPCVGQTWVEFDGFAEFGDRPVKLSTLPKRKTAFVMILGDVRRLRLSRARCEHQRERRRRDYGHNDSMAEHLFSSTESPTKPTQPRSALVLFLPPPQFGLLPPALDLPHHLRVARPFERLLFGLIEDLRMQVIAALPFRLRFFNGNPVFVSVCV